MQKFKIAVSKDQKKYTLVLSAANEAEARDKVHKQGYSILSVSAIWDLEISGQQFYFQGFLDGEEKKWKVVWDDIFKIYVKLRKDLWYNIKYLYSSSDQELSIEEKQKIIRDLETSYNIHFWFKEDIKQEKIIEKKDDLDGFYMKKELQETYALMKIVLKKLEDIMRDYEFYGLDSTWLEKIKNTYNSIIKIKKTTNISKLKEVWEKALMKIGSIELKSIEKDKNTEQRKLLKQTNELLRKLGSHQKFIEQNKDINKILSQVFVEIKQSILSVKDSLKPEKVEKIDKWSYSYVKTKLLKQKYQTRAKQNRNNILQNFLVFLFPFWKNKEIKDNLLIKKRVIHQNISLLDAKLSWRVYSYVKIIKWYKKLIDFILGMFFYIKDSLFLVIFVYSLILVSFITLQNVIWINMSINFSGLYYFIIATFIYFVILLSRWVLSLLLNFVFLSFIIIFATVNF